MTINGINNRTRNKRINCENIIKTTPNGMNLLGIKKTLIQPMYGPKPT